jgi:hypothetical protein
MAAAGTSAQLTTSGSSLDASLLSYQPVPAQPGDLLDVWIQVVNNGGSPSKGGTVTIFPSLPFTIEGAGNDVKAFPTIPPQSSFLIKTTVRVDKSANEGENHLKARVQEEGSANWVDRDLVITVKGRSSALSIVSATTSPEPIPPGSPATLTLIVRNIGDTRLRNVDVSLDLRGLSLAPTTSSNSKTIDMLAGGQEATFTFDVITYPDATPKASQLPLTITYQDEQGNTKNQSETIGIVIGAKPELLVYFEKVDVRVKTLEGPVIIKFVNKGLSQIKLLQMTVLQNNDVKVTSESPTLYVGNIDPDDYQSSQVTLKLSKESVKVPISVSYRDALNQEYQETITLDLAAHNGTSSGGLGWWTVIIVLLVVGGSVWLFVRRRRRHKAK